MTTDSCSCFLSHLHICSSTPVFTAETHSFYPTLFYAYLTFLLYPKTSPIYLPPLLRMFPPFFKTMATFCLSSAPFTTNEAFSLFSDWQKRQGNPRRKKLIHTDRRERKNNKNKQKQQQEKLKERLIE